MYLANDILQNSRKKGDEYLNEFATVLAEVKFQKNMRLYTF